MKTKLFLSAADFVQIDHEVTAKEADPGYQEVDAPKLMEAVSKDPELLEQLRAMLGKAFASGHLYGYWECLNESRAKRLTDRTNGHTARCRCSECQRLDARDRGCLRDCECPSCLSWKLG